MGVGRGGRKVTEKGSVQEGIGGWPGRGEIWKWAGLRSGGKGEDVVWEKNFLKTKLSSEAGDAALQRRDAVGLASPCLAPRALCLTPARGRESNWYSEARDCPQLADGKPSLFRFPWPLRPLVPPSRRLPLEPSRLVAALSCLNQRESGEWSRGAGLQWVRQWSSLGQIVTILVNNDSRL